MNEHYKDFLATLNNCGVRYLVVGAYAVMAHTQPRFTNDIDVAIELTPENARRAFKALAEFGAPLDGLEPDDFLRPTEFYRFEGRFAKMDVLFGLDHTDFESAWSRRVVASIEGVEVPVAGLQDLKEMKRLADRPQDRLDLEKLELAERLRADGLSEQVRTLERNHDRDIDLTTKARPRHKL